MRRFSEVQLVSRLLIAVFAATSFVPPMSAGAASHEQCRAAQCDCGCCSPPVEALPPCCAAEKTAPPCRCAAAPEKPSAPQQRAPSSEWREWTSVLALPSSELGIIRPGDSISLPEREVSARVRYLPEPCVLCRWLN